MSCRISLWRNLSPNFPDDLDDTYETGIEEETFQKNQIVSETQKIILEPIISLQIHNITAISQIQSAIITPSTI